MKITLLYLAVFLAFTAAGTSISVLSSKRVLSFPSPPPPQVSQEGIWHNIGRAAKQGLKDLAKEVGKEIFEKAKNILTDGLHLSPTPEVQEALRSEPSHEGIFDFTVDALLKRAAEIAAEKELHRGPSHEGIVSEFGIIHTISDAEQFLYPTYNKSIRYEGPSHEGLLGGLGGLVIKGLGDLIGGTAGKVIRNAGDVVGNLLYVVPEVISKEGIIEVPSQEGILSSATKVLLKGAGKLAGGILKGVFGPATKIFGNIFLARGHFNNYQNIQTPAHEIILQGRHKIHDHTHPEVKTCIDAAEKNFSSLYSEYSAHGHGCILAGETHGKRIFAKVEDIVLDAVKRVEDSHRETGFCFEKRVEEDRIICLDHYIPDMVRQHREKILHYGKDLADYVRQFSDVNTEFDACLTKHLGDVRREVYLIVQNFHTCIDSQEVQNN